MGPSDRGPEDVHRWFETLVDDEKLGTYSVFGCQRIRDRSSRGSSSVLSAWSDVGASEERENKDVYFRQESRDTRDGVEDTIGL